MCITATLEAYNKWVDLATQTTGPLYAVPELFGFFMGFRKDHPVADHQRNILVHGSLNFHQGTRKIVAARRTVAPTNPNLKAFVALDVIAWRLAERFLFWQWNVPSYVCANVFVYHVKSATLVRNDDGVRKAKAD